MATAINRTTKRLVRSIHTPDYSVVDWIINPNLSLLDGIVPQKYWKIVGDSVLEMEQTEKNEVDAAEAAIINIPIAGTQMAMFTDSRVGSNQYINIGSLSSSAVGFLLPTRGIVRHISAQWSSGENFSINLRRNGVATNLYTFDATGSTKQSIASNINISLSAGDSMQIYIDDIDYSGVYNLVVMVWFDLLGN